MSAYPRDDTGAAFGGRATFHRFTTRNLCPHCDHEGPCIYFDNGDVLCHREGQPGNWTDSFIGGYWHRALDTTGHQPVPRRLPSPSTPPITPADLTLRNAVYADLLRPCPLSEDQRAAHQLTDAQARRYGWLPSDPAGQARLIATLLGTYTREELLSVPGFREHNGHITIRGAGLMLPTRDLDGHIQAIDHRRNTVADGQARYYKLSSRTPDDQDAPGPGAPPHVAIPVGGITVDGVIGVTEGVKKADYAADALGYPVVSIPGVGSWRAAVGVLERFAGNVVVLMLDQDDPDKNEGSTVAAVERARTAIATAAVSLGYAVRLATWDHAVAKGVDDLLTAGRTFTLERYCPAADELDTAATAAISPTIVSLVVVMAKTLRIQRAALQRAYAKIKDQDRAYDALERFVLTEGYTESEKKMLTWTLRGKFGYRMGMPIPDTFPTVHITDEEKPRAGLSTTSFDTARKRLVKEGVLIEESRKPGPESKTGYAYKMITVDGERLEHLLVGLHDDPDAQTEERIARAATRAEEARERSEKARHARERREEMERATRMSLAAIGGERRHFAEVTEQLSHQLTEKEAEATAMRQAALDAQREAQRIIEQARRESIPCGGCGTLIAIKDWRCDDCRAEGTDADRWAVEPPPSFGGKEYVKREPIPVPCSTTPSSSPIPPKLGGGLAAHMDTDAATLPPAHWRPCYGGCGTLQPPGATCKACRERQDHAAGVAVPLHILTPNSATTARREL